MQKLWNKRIRSEIKHFLQLLVFMKCADICNLGNQYSLQNFFNHNHRGNWSHRECWAGPSEQTGVEFGDGIIFKKVTSIKVSDTGIRHRQFIFPTKSIVISHIHTSCDATCNNSSCDTQFNFTTKWINNIQINYLQGGDNYLNVKTSFFPQTSN